MASLSVALFVGGLETLEVAVSRRWSRSLCGGGRRRSPCCGPRLRWRGKRRTADKPQRYQIEAVVAAMECQRGFKFSTLIKKHIFIL